MSAFTTSLNSTLKALCIGVYKVKARDIKFKISAESLFSSTFKIPEKDRYSVSKSVLFLIKTIFFAPVKKIPDDLSGDIIFDATDDSILNRKKYVKYFSGLTEVGFMDYRHLVCYPTFFKKIIYGFIFSLLLPFFFLSLLISDKKKRAGISLLFEEIIVLSNMIDICLKNNVKAIYHFCIYETYSNLFSLVLMKKGIRIIKIPSEVPLSIWNKKIIADTLVICNAYQYEEIEAFKETMVFNSTEFWGPELILDIKDFYKTQTATKPELAIGFYSTGGWLRRKLGHIDQGMNIEENELKVKLALKKYVQKHKLSLGIFLHPREKAEANLEMTRMHYDDVFKGIDYSFLPFGVPNNEMFNKVDLAVAFSSTIMFERLYCGFKCLFIPLGFDNFPLPLSPLKNVCATSEDEIENKLGELSKLSVADYFSMNKLQIYSRLNSLS